MVFVKIHKRARCPKLPFDFISVRTTSIVLGDKIKEQIKPGDAVELLIDEQARKIGIRKTEDEDGFPVNTEKKHSSYINCATTVKEIKNAQYKVTEEDGMWVFKFDWSPVNKMERKL